MTNWPVVLIASEALSLTLIVAMYVFLWWRNQRSSMGLWSLGWALYVVHFVTQGLNWPGTLPSIWHFVRLSALGLSSFLLYAGAYAFADRSLPRRIYVWGIFPLLWALVVFLPLPFDVVLAAIPLFLFVTLLDVLTVQALFRHAGVHRLRAGVGLVSAYVLWIGFKLAWASVPFQGEIFIAWSMLTAGLALSLALFLVAANLIGAEQEGDRRADRLQALSRLVATTGQVLSLEELLQAALDELVPLFSFQGGVGAFLYDPLENPSGLQMVARHGVYLSCSAEGPKEACPCQQAIHSRQVIVPRNDASFNRAECSHNLAIPLFSHDQVLGAICGTLPPGFQLPAGELQVMETIGQQLGLALENALLYRQTQQRVRRLSLLHEIDRHVASALDLNAILRAIAHQIRRLFDLSTLHLGLYDAEVEELHFPLIIKAGEERPSLRLKLSKGAGLGGWVIGSREPLWIDDLDSGREELPAPAIILDPASRTVAILPLVIRERAVGVMALQFATPHALNEEHKRLLEDVSHQLAIAVDNARLYAAQEQRAEEAGILLEIVNAANSTLEPRRILREIAIRAARACGADRCTILLCDEHDETVVPIMSQFASGEVNREMWLRFKETSPPQKIENSPEALHVLRRREPCFIPDVHSSSLPSHWRESFNVGSLLIVPLINREQVIGLMGFDRPEADRAFTPEQVNLALMIGAQVASAIENARLYQETARRLKEAQVLQEISTSIASTLDFDQVLERAIQTLDRLLGVEYLNFMLPDEEGEFMLPHPSMLGFSPSLLTDHRMFPIDSCATGRVYRTGRPALIPNVHEASDYAVLAEDVRSELAVPVRVGNEVAAVLNVESRRHAAFDEESLAFYTAVAGQLGVALKNVRLYQAEQERRREAETLYRAAQALTKTLDLQEVFDRILSELQQVVPYDSASVQLLQDEGLSIIGGRGFPNLEELLGFTFDPQLSNNPNGLVMKRGAPVILEDAPVEYGEFMRAPHAAARIRAWMGVPLLFGDQVIGILAVDKNEPGFYTPEHARLAVAFAGQAAIAIENARLYQELEKQSTRLRDAVTELQELDQLRNQVVQNVSHELRTPLTLIQGYAELLLDGDLGAVVPSQRRALEMIHERSMVLARLIYNLTALQSLPREALAIVPLSLAEVVEHVLADYSHRAERAHIRFDCYLRGHLPMILGDRDRLSLVFLHLIDNAIKFSPDGGSIAIHGWVEGEYVKVSIQDQGIGIAPEHISRIFERFYQVDGSTTRRFGGMGIGLALVWEIVEAHGGQVIVESEPGEGSRFTVSLPQAERFRE